MRWSIAGVTAATLLSLCSLPVSAFPGHPATTAAMTKADIAARDKAISDDQFAGRGPGTEQGEAAAQWIAEELARIGVAPATHGSYFQKVPTEVIALDAEKSRFAFHTAKGDITPKFPDQAVYWTSHYAKPDVHVKKSDLVFVGYGVVAPEFGWNDYKGVDVRGKTVVILINDPGNEDASPDPKFFGGKAMTYYGRWTYKYEEAARQGAAAAIIVHETKPAAYGWQVVRNSNSGAMSWLETTDKNESNVPVQGWITHETAIQLFADAGLDYYQEKAAANKPGFHAVALKGETLDVDAFSHISQLVTRNVVGILNGSEHPEDKVLLSAHWDHLGVKPDVKGPDKIYNGAVDNGMGISMILDMAEAFAHAKTRTKRSLVFFFPTLEEQGLLGAAYFASHPLWPLKHIVGDFNLDADQPAPAMTDMIVPGFGSQNLQDFLIRALKEQGRHLSPHPQPELGHAFRADHFAFAKMGVPAITPNMGTELKVGGKAGAQALRDDYVQHHYHQPTDEYDPAWDMTNPLLDEEAVHNAAEMLANSDVWPNWSADSPFRAARDKMMRKAYPGHHETSVNFTAADLKYRVKAISDDAFEGRGPGTEAGEAAAQWIADELKLDGVAPGARGEYFQKVPTALVTLNREDSRLTFQTAHGTITPKVPDEAVYWTPHYAAANISLKNLPVVFAGYGVVAPEYHWNDYKDIDVKGKLVIVLVNDPGFADPASGLFKGKAMTYYGRWPYKYEEAARQGAAAVLIVHETQAAAYGWNVVRNSQSAPHSWLISQDRNASRAAIEGWITHGTAEKLFRDSGFDFLKLEKAAAEKGFHAVELPGAHLDVHASSKVEYLTTRNVIGMVRGKKRPSEVVMYSAHWDHLGVNPDAAGADKIYNGAVDNGMGVAMTLALAQKFAHGPRPDRTVVFLFSTLEEQGLLGTEFFVRHPYWQLKHIVGDINLDGTHPSAGTRNMTVSGTGQNALEDDLAVALKAQGRTLSPDAHPEAGLFFRADHFSFARAGVPAISPESGNDWVEGGVKAGEEAEKVYRDQHYHQPSDEYDPNWNMTGPLEDLNAVYAMGRTLANSDVWPEWKAGSEFKARREAMLKR